MTRLVAYVNSGVASAGPNGALYEPDLTHSLVDRQTSDSLTSTIHTMGTQNAGGIPFAIAGEQQAFRLLELPNELLELLTSSDPPM